MDSEIRFWTWIFFFIYTGGCFSSAKAGAEQPINSGAVHIKRNMNSVPKKSAGDIIDSDAMRSQQTLALQKMLELLQLPVADRVIRRADVP
jgi:hypothetical protein